MDGDPLVLEIDRCETKCKKRCNCLFRHRETRARGGQYHLDQGVYRSNAVCSVPSMAAIGLIVFSPRDIAPITYGFSKKILINISRPEVREYRGIYRHQWSSVFQRELFADTWLTAHRSKASCRSPEYLSPKFQ